MSDAGSLLASTVEPQVLEVDTPRGPARVHVRGDRSGGGAGATLVLGHGAGGGVGAPDLLVVQEVALAAGWRVVLVEQPYRVAGRRAPAPAAHLDEAWLAVLGTLAPAGPLVVGGRSSGARVACRTARACGADAVLCLAFPLVPPRAARPTSRAPELDGVGVPVLVVQGARDRFARPEVAPGREVVVVPGDHSLHIDTAAVASAVAAWLPRHGARALSTG